MKNVAQFRQWTFRPELWFLDLTTHMSIWIWMIRFLRIMEYVLMKSNASNANISNKVVTSGHCRALISSGGSCGQEDMDCSLDLPAKRDGDSLCQVLPSFLVLPRPLLPKLPLPLPLPFPLPLQLPLPLPFHTPFPFPSLPLSPGCSLPPSFPLSPLFKAWLLFYLTIFAIFFQEGSWSKNANNTTGCCVHERSLENDIWR